jgi:hypothetical protein
MERCRAAGIAVWVDEVQTFARTGELFAYRTFGLEDLVDVVTCGKALQGSAVLFRARYNPKPGLVAGTYAGATVGLAVGARIISASGPGCLGPEGASPCWERVERFEICAGCLRAIERRDRRHARFVPFDGRRVVRDVLQPSRGLVFQRVSPRVRMLLPVDVRRGRAASRCQRRCAVGSPRRCVLILRPGRASGRL